MASAGRYSWTRDDGTTGRAWRARWVDAGGASRQRGGFDRKADALAYAADREAEARHGVTLAGERPSGRTTVETWAEAWLAAQEVRPGTLDSYRYCLARVRRDFGARSLASLRPSELKTWRKALGQRYAPATADQTAAVLAMLLRAAVVDGLLERSPMPAGRGGTSGRVVDPDQLLTLQQVRAWDAALPEHARGMALVAAATGLRQGELLGLTADRIDWLRRQVRVDRQLQRGELVPPKTAAGVRTVPLAGIATDALAARLAGWPAEPGQPVFRTLQGRPWSRSGFQSAWRTAAERASVPVWAHWHSLRDVFASSLIRQRTDLRAVITLMGHASSDETIRVYSRLWADAQDRARAGIDELWANEPQADRRDFSR